jgi:transcriptional regulator with XRE-family HTH domain
MFWERFFNICTENKQTPNYVCSQLGLSTATATHWKRGVMPKADIVIKIANYFNCSTDYLLGKSDIFISNDNNELSEKEKKLIAAYRDKPDMQKSVDVLLGVTEGEFKGEIIGEQEKTNVAKIAAFGGGISTKVYKDGEIDEEEIRKLVKEREVKDDF